MKIEMVDLIVQIVVMMNTSWPIASAGGEVSAIVVLRERVSVEEGEDLGGDVIPGAVRREQKGRLCLGGRFEEAQHAVLLLEAGLQQEGASGLEANHCQGLRDGGAPEEIVN